MIAPTTHELLYALRAWLDYRLSPEAQDRFEAALFDCIREAHSRLCEECPNRAAAILAAPVYSRRQLEARVAAAEKVYLHALDVCWYDFSDDDEDVQNDVQRLRDACSELEATQAFVPRERPSHDPDYDAWAEQAKLDRAERNESDRQRMDCERGTL